MPFYGVAKGFTTGIYTSWPACTQAINGFSGAIFKKFDTRMEAEDFINGTNTLTIQKPKSVDYYVYTDGSCSRNGFKNAQAGIGVYFGPGDPRNLSERISGKQTNNTAEISALIQAYKIVEPDLKQNKHIIICSDSQYAIRCATSYGQKQNDINWSADIPNKDLVKTVYNLYRSQPNIEFQYVAAHTGKSDIHSIGNDAADRLANQAISVNTISLHDLSVNTISLHDLSVNTISLHDESVNDVSVNDYIEPVISPTHNSNRKIYLQVPYEQKDKAKALGASWDYKRKKWYINESSENKQTLVNMFSLN